jgi:hypothetical protein
MEVLGAKMDCAASSRRSFYATTGASFLSIMGVHMERQCCNETGHALFIPQIGFSHCTSSLAKLAGTHSNARMHATEGGSRKRALKITMSTFALASLASGVAVQKVCCRCRVGLVAEAQIKSHLYPSELRQL